MADFIEEFKKYPLKKRKKESKRIMCKYPNTISIIISKMKEYDDVPYIDKNKFIVPTYFNVSQFLYIIRKRIKLLPYKGLFIYINGNTLPNTHDLIGSLYYDYKNEDGFLYIKYCGENVFG